MLQLVLTGLIDYRRYHIIANQLLLSALLDGNNIAYNLLYFEHLKMN